MADSLEHSKTYHFIRWLFTITCNVFYTNIHIDGANNVPEQGEATILLFNHGNSLADSVVLIGSTKRMVRFCAKDTLWNIPFFGTLIRNSGALPLFRKREHGSKAMENNQQAFRAVHQALLDGYCVGLAPEGRSDVTPFVDTFKKGPAFIALGALEKSVNSGNNLKINFVPAGLCYTHREKFRSNAAVRFGEPFVVDTSYVDGTKFSSTKEAANAITKEIQKRMHDLTINSPDFDTVAKAITATRIYQPCGTLMTLNEYLDIINGWVELLKLPVLESPEKLQNVPDHIYEYQLKHISSKVMEDIRRARTHLAMYQRVLDKNGINDERVRRIELIGMSPSYQLVGKLILRVLASAVLFVLASPGLILFTPVRILVRRKERALLKKGHFWADSIAEYKMMISFCALAILLLVGNVFAPLLFLCLWFAMRFYEDSVASWRTAIFLYNLLLLTPQRIESLLRLRHMTKKLVEELAYYLPEKTKEVSLKLAEKHVHLHNGNETVVFRNKWYMFFNPLRRSQVDYNEVLRLHDHTTMDYVS